MLHSPLLFAILGSTVFILHRPIVEIVLKHLNEDGSRSPFLANSYYCVLQTNEILDPDPLLKKRKLRLTKFLGFSGTFFVS